MICELCEDTGKIYTGCALCDQDISHSKCDSQYAKCCEDAHIFYPIGVRKKISDRIKRIDYFVNKSEYKNEWHYDFALWPLLHKADDALGMQEYARAEAILDGLYRRYGFEEFK